MLPFEKSWNIPNKNHLNVCLHVCLVSLNHWPKLRSSIHTVTNHGEVQFTPTAAIWDRQTGVKFLEIKPTSGQIHDTIITTKIWQEGRFSFLTQHWAATDHSTALKIWPAMGKS